MTIPKLSTKIKFILIGVGNYTSETHLNNDSFLENRGFVLEGLNALNDQINETFQGFSGSGNYSIEKILNPESKDQLFTNLERIRKKKDHNLLVVYYSGHGERISNGNLMLTTSNCTIKTIHRRGVEAINFVNEIIKHPVEYKIIILDCCYSGKLNGINLGTNKGVTIMSSCGATEKARKGKKYPIYTETIINILKNGLNTGRHLSIEDVAEAIPEELSTGERKQRPKTTCINRNKKSIVFPNVQLKQNKNVGIATIPQGIIEYTFLHKRLDRHPQQGVNVAKPEMIPIHNEFSPSVLLNVASHTQYTILASKYPVTIGDYNFFCRANNLKIVDTEWKEEKMPLINISWLDSLNYCNWLSMVLGYEPVYSIRGDTVVCNPKGEGFRLPSESEWMYAARAGKVDNYNYSGGDILSKVAFYAKNSKQKTNEVGKKKPNELGIHGLCGNIWEWCWNEYSNGQDARSISFPSISITKGGSWNSPPQSCEIKSSERFEIRTKKNTIGFRVFQSVKK